MPVLCPDPDDDPPRHPASRRTRCRRIGAILAPLSQPVRRRVYAALSATRHRQGPLDDEHRNRVLAAVLQVASDLDHYQPGHPQARVLHAIRRSLERDIDGREARHAA